MWVRHEAFVELLQENPVIAAVKDATGLSRSMDSDCQIVFVLSGNLLGVKEVVSRVHEAGKLAMVHIDLIDGLAARDVAVDFIAESTRADGIISTRSNLVRRAKARGMLAVQRFFMLDSIALVNIEKRLSFEAADAVEILPGAMPKVIRRLAAIVRKPMIAGGLISDKEDVLNALGAGAVAVSSSNPEVWLL